MPACGCLPDWHSFIQCCASRRAMACGTSAHGRSGWLSARDAFIPIEIRALTHGITALRCGALAVNLMIIAYMVFLLRAGRRERRRSRVAGSGTPRGARRLGSNASCPPAAFLCIIMSARYDGGGLMRVFLWWAHCWRFRRLGWLWPRHEFRQRSAVSDDLWFAVVRASDRHAIDVR